MANLRFLPLALLDECFHAHFSNSTTAIFLWLEAYIIVFQQQVLGASRLALWA